MKIEQTFKDAKSLLKVEKVMNKDRHQLEMSLALVLLAYGLGLTIGEEKPATKTMGRVRAGHGTIRRSRRVKKGLYFESEALPLQKEVGALLWVIRAVEKAAEVRGEAVARGAKAGSSHLAAPTFSAFGW